jgi:hypothetical protein
MNDYSNMPYYEPYVEFFEIKINIPLDPRKDYYINDANVVSTDPIVVDKIVTPPLTVIDKNLNNPKPAILISIVPVPVTIPPVDIAATEIKNNYKDAISGMYKSEKKANRVTKDKDGGDFDEQDEDNDAVNIVKAKEDGASIFDLLGMM